MSSIAKTLFFGVIILLSLKFNAQTIDDGKGWIRVDNPIYQASNSDSQQFTNNQDFNNLLESYNVTEYKIALPFAKNPELLKYHQISCNCDLQELVNSFSSAMNDGLSNFSKDYIPDTATVYNPTDWMWWAQSNNQINWLWYLDMIEADKAWDVTRGDTSVKVAILDYDLDHTHDDINTEVLLPYDPYTPSTQYDCYTWSGHGTMVSSFVSGETAEQGTTPNGQLASIGFNTKMYNYEAQSNISTFLQKALHASNVMGVRAIVSCAGGGLAPRQFSPAEPLIIKEILDNGTSIIVPAGNGPTGTRNRDPQTNLSIPFYPFHPSYDDRIIIVTSIGIDNKHYYYHQGRNREETHSHFPEVDVCAPGYEIMAAVPTSCDTTIWPYYGYATGTSFSSPLVAGIVSLMYSANPCLSTSDVKSILKSTTDTVADGHLYQDSIGTGRVNAKKAVEKSHAAYSSSLDLYVRDRWDDYGLSGGYHWQATRDNSPDIWVRNQQDGLTNQSHQSPEYQTSSPVYVYVRVRNKSCDTSSSQESLKLYWSKASSWSSWPQNWDGTSPAIGNLIDSIVVPPIAPGKDTILEFTWNILNPYIYANWTTCLLARIEGNSIDPITIYPGRIDDDVYFNNNIAMKNLTIIDSINGIIPPEINGSLYPVGRYVFIGNTQSEATNINLVFNESIEGFNGSSIIDEAQVKILTDRTGWNILSPIVNETEGIEALSEEDYSFIISNSTVLLEEIEFPANTRIPIYLGFNFIMDEVSGESFTYQIQQKLSNTDELLGGVYFKISRKERPPFYADAGSDQTIKLYNSTTLNAVSLSEPAIYKWFDENNELINENLSVEVSPEISTNYTLEVTSKTDGYVDYDDVRVNVIQNWIESISPNPTNNSFELEYTINEASTASIVILNNLATSQQTYSIPPSSGTVNIDISDYTNGSYTVVLVIDGIAIDSKNLVKY